MALVTNQLQQTQNLRLVFASIALFVKWHILRDINFRL